ncbi:sulfotransferase domain-containing protein [Alphaproteobacteria bacterium]|jgi:hypothetical protein|nr:sulfotransferase domain-containing protein [Alphaproteobacteria bacterium]
MQKNIFLSSYPKSGNTWLRAIIISALSKKKFSLDELKKILLLSSKKNFKDLKNIKYSDDGDIDFDWMSENIINCQKNLNEANKDLNIYKTHSVKHRKFTNETVNMAFIYIVRDPRDIAISLTHFAGGSLDQTINEMLYSKKLMTSTNGAKELVSTWDLHTKSWLEYNNVSRLIIRYEDLINKTEEYILKIFNFLNKITNNTFFLNKIDINKIIQETSINNLKKEEGLFGFKEASKYSRFFRSGKTEQWKDILSLGQIKLINKELFPMMKQLNYL